MLTLLNHPCVVLLYTKVANGVPPELPANNPDPDNAAPVVTLPPAMTLAFDVTLPVALINPPVKIFAPVIFAALVIVLVAEINPAVNKLAPLMLPLAVNIFPD